ncbi:serine protease [Phytomonospora sp. NPDC050363]|uniref:S1 family peptidase n=1 Tax=Phytomonospora sp. NPDC050363 TaxID=3155642 RepID=UPI0033DD9215
MKRKIALLAAAFAVAAAPAITAAPAQAGDITPDIVGGTPAGEPYPFVASLQYTRNGVPNSHRCGTTLIDKTWVVTAAHCVTNADGTPMPAETFHIAIGNIDHRLGEHIKVTQVVVHPDYETPAENNADIALLELERAATQKPADIGYVGVGDPVRMLGWGRTVEEDPASLSPILQELDSTLLENPRCVAGDEWDITVGDICVDIPGGDTGPCYGDSGSPVLNKDARGRWEILGVVSRGPGTGCLNGPEVYTSTYYYEDWIWATLDA